MKKIPLALFTLAFLSLAASIQFTPNPYKKKPTTNPGWRDQYAAMKNLQPGMNYFGLRNKWAESDKLYKKSSDVIDNIKEVGPYNVGGRIRALLIDAADSNHILAGGISGGLWTSYDAGKSWKPIDEHAVSLAVSCITQNPFNPNEIYYGTGEGTGNSADISGGGIFKSIDGGKTFSQLPASASIAEFSSIWDIEFSKTDSKTFYIGVGNGGFYRSTNSGNTISRVFTTSKEVNEIVTYPDSTVWFGVNGYGIMNGREKDTMKFSLLTGGLPTSGFGRISMAYCANFPNVAFCQIVNTAGNAISGIYKTSNHGKNWKKMANPSISSVYPYAWYCLNTNISPVDTNFVLAISVKHLASKNGGTSWSELTETHADNHSSAFFPSGRNFLIGNDGGLYRFNYLSYQTNMVSLNNGLNITQFYTGTQSGLNSSNFITGAQDNGTHYYNGSVFVKAFGGDGSHCALSPTAPYYTYVSYQNGEIRRFTGTNFFGETNIKPSGSLAFWFINPFIINMLNGNHVYFLTKNKILFSSNSGSNWVNLTNNLNKQVLSIGMSNSTDPTVYFGGGGTALYRAKNAATTTLNEVDLTASAPTTARGSVINCIRVKQDNPNTVYLSMSDVNSKPRVWKLNNAESDAPVWINISGNLPASLPVNSIIINPLDSTEMVAGTDFGLYVTNNEGITWVKENAIPNVSVFSISLHPQSGKFVIFTHGRGAFTAQFKNFVTSVKPASSINSSQISFTNPVGNELKLYLNGIDKNVVGRLEIFGLDGKLVFAQNEISERPINLNSVAGGTYLMKLEIGTQQFTYRLLKL